MSANRAAIRYAKAVLDITSESNISNVVFGDMQSVHATIEGSKELRNVLQSPIVKTDDKKKALLTIFSGQNDITKRLIEILATNKRIGLLGGVAKSYIALYNEKEGIKEAHVTTAVELTSALEEKILAKVKELTGSQKVTLKNEVDESLIGGFVLRVGDIQYDASISNQFRKLKREFSKSLN